MDLRISAIAGPRRRLIDLGFRPGLQIKLPVVLLLVTIAFAMLFLAHTREAYGFLFEVGLEDPWLRAFVLEIQHDFFVVSIAIMSAYAIAISGICLAGTHRVLGPIVVLRKHLESLKRGDYASRVRLRSGHPLSGVAADLNDLSEILQGATHEESAESQAQKNVSTPEPASRAVEHLLRLYSSAEVDDAEREAEPSLWAGQAG